MISSLKLTSVIAASSLALCALLAPADASAHCDGMDGPVVRAARTALDSGNVNAVLIWVHKGDEAQVRKEFDRALRVRKLGPEAREMADTYFFETLVRLHRAGEGAPYTGLKPAGRDLGPAIPAADKALETGSVEPVVKLISDTSRDTIEQTFRRAMEMKKHADESVEAGREFVKAYVTFVHTVEGIHAAAKSPAHGHAPDDAGATPGKTGGDAPAPVHHHD